MVDDITEAGQGATKYTLSNPHPLHGKDPNILNEYGHTEYPKFVHQFDEKGAIARKHEVGDKFNDKGIPYKTILNTEYSSRIVNNADEEAEAAAEGFTEKWVKPEKKKVEVTKTKTQAPGWDK